VTRRLLVAALVALVLAGTAAASEARPTLDELEQELTCPTCKTSLALSDAPVADQIRAFVQERIAAGDTKSEIKDKLVADYGPQILAAPPKNGFNLLAWALPIVLLLGGGLVVGLLAWRWSHSHEPGPPAATTQLSPALERRVDEELARYDEG
jgi:cytochrome c-type biogenesis protein CcmH